LDVRSPAVQPLRGVGDWASIRLQVGAGPVEGDGSA